MVLERECKPKVAETFLLVEEIVAENLLHLQTIQNSNTLSA